MLAHGAVLRSNIFSDEEVEAIARDYRTAGLSPAEVAMMSFAQKVTLNAYRVSPEDIYPAAPVSPAEFLRGVGRALAGGPC